MIPEESVRFELLWGCLFAASFEVGLGKENDPFQGSQHRRQPDLSQDFGLGHFSGT